MVIGDNGDPLVVVQDHVVAVFKDTNVFVTALPLKMVEEIALVAPLRPGGV